VVSVEGPLAIVEIRGIRTRADATLVSVRPGDFVLVQSGLILETLDPKDAQERLRLLARILGEAEA